MISEFHKYQGAGNDFIIIDDRNLQFPSKNISLIARLCNRKFGIGADGLILLQPQTDGDFFMKYFNSDGRESSMCGNGGRCIAAYAFHQQIVSANTRFMATDGWHEAIIHPPLVKLKMQDVKSISVRNEHDFVLNTGSPHYVSFTSIPVAELNLIKLAKTIRHNSEFNNEGINVNFINSTQPNEISMRTFERGVEDETLSCGTGVTAAVLCSALFNNYSEGNYRTEVETPGGKLAVTFSYCQNPVSFKDIWLEGPAECVFKGEISV